jgi:ATP-dependent RNA helicase DeaD
LKKWELFRKFWKQYPEWGFKEPMPVQEQVIPLLLDRSTDIIALAQTGTGKTAAFGIPVVQLTDPQNKNPQTVILAPTRELCVQIANDLISYARYLKQIRILAVYGGSSIETQIRELKKGVHILVQHPTSYRPDGKKGRQNC